jgi:hypothetical protein
MLIKEVLCLLLLKSKWKYTIVRSAEGRTLYKEICHQGQLAHIVGMNVSGHSNHRETVLNYQCGLIRVLLSGFKVALLN